jgi:large subunit ribosomal protein L35
MPKQKTRKSVTKRFKVTKNGKIMRRHNFSRHLRVKKSGAKKRGQKRPVELTGYFAKKLRKALGVRSTGLRKRIKYGKS